MGKRQIIFSEDDEPQGGDTSMAATSDTSTRPSRKTKEGAKKKWEALVPGQARKRKKETQPLSDGEEDDGDVGSGHLSKSKKSKPNATGGRCNTKVQQPSKPVRSNLYRAPHIDPDAPSDDEDATMEDITIEAEVPVSNGDVQQLKNRDPHLQRVPPRFRKSQDAKTGTPDDGVSSSEDDGAGHAGSDEDEISGEEEHTDDEDAGLEQLEKDPRALAKTFADETAYWVDEDDSHSDGDEHPPKRSGKASRSSSKRSSRPAVRRSPPLSQPPSRSVGLDLDDDLTSQQQSRSSGVSSGGHKRASAERSDIDDDNEPPAKKPSKTKSAHKAVVQAHKSHGTSHSPAAAKKPYKSSQQVAQHVPKASTPKRATSRREDEKIPKFRDESIASKDKTSGPRKPRGTDKKSHASAKVRPVKNTSRAPDSDVDGLTIEDASSIESGSEDSGIDIVFPDRGKLKLGEQHFRVRRVIKRGIYMLLSDISLKNAFPDAPQKQGQVVYRALLNAAAEFAYDDILRRLKTQKDDYAAELCKIPSQRIPTFRGGVRKVAEGQPCTAFGLTFGDKAKGDWLQDGLRYIYPFDYETKTVKGAKPYHPPVFVETLRVAFFKRPSSFGFEISKFFESSLPDKPDEKEIPAAMLALVATALHAAIEDCKHGYTVPRDFTANDYWSVYNEHIQELSSIRVRGPVQYHVLMHGFWRQISMPMGSAVRAGAPRKSFLDIDSMALE